MDSSVSAAAVQSCYADITTQLPIRETVRLNEVAGLKGRIDPFTDIILLQIANTGAITDANVRLAAHHAIDKQGISKAFFNGAAAPLSVLAVPGSPGFVEGFNFPFSLEKAKDYLAKSGFGPTRIGSIRPRRSASTAPSSELSSQGCATATVGGRPCFALAISLSYFSCCARLGSSMSFLVQKSVAGCAVRLVL